MKHIVEIKLLDENITKYECTDFPYTAGEFFVLCLDGFRRKYIRQSTILNIEQYFTS